jgi:hypothetical protein
LFAALVMPGIALAAIVAVVTDLAGQGARGRLTGGRASSRFWPLSTRTPWLNLIAGTKLVALYLDVSDEYAFDGRSRITFGSARPAVVPRFATGKACALIRQAAQTATDQAAWSDASRNYPARTGGRPSG